MFFTCNRSFHVPVDIQRNQCPRRFLNWGHGRKTTTWYTNTIHYDAVSRKDDAMPCHRTGYDGGCRWAETNTCWYAKYVLLYCRTRHRVWARSQETLRDVSRPQEASCGRQPHASTASTLSIDRLQHLESEKEKLL